MMFNVSFLFLLTFLSPSVIFKVSTQLLLGNLITTVTSGCPTGWVYELPYCDICYRIVNTTLFNYNDATTYCQSLNSASTIPIFKNANEFRSYNALLNRLDTTRCTIRSWIGIIYNSSLSGLSWLDGSPLSFTKWVSQPNSTVGTCATQLFSGGNWQIESCGNMSRLICQLRLTSANDSINYEVAANYATCPSPFTPDRLGICYRSVTMKSWQNATAYCKSLHPNATLPVFCDNTEYSSYLEAENSKYFCASTQWLGYLDNGTSVFKWSNNNLPLNNTWINIKNSTCPSTANSCGISRGPAFGQIIDNLCCSMYSLPFQCQLRMSNRCYGIADTANIISTLTYCTRTTTSETTTTTTTTAATTTTSTQTTTSISQTSTEETSTTLSTIAVSTGVYAQPLLVALGIDEVIAASTPSLSVIIQDSIPFTLQSLNDSTKKMLGYQLEDMIRMCTFNSRPCTLKTYFSDFQQRYDPLLGNCYTFNAANNLRHWATNAGSIYGLKLILSASQSDYTCTTSFAGFRVVIHDNNVQPFPDSQGYNIPLTTDTGFSLFQSELEKLGYPYSDCAGQNFNGFVNNYSIEACQRNCFQKHLIDTCGCADPRYSLIDASDFCDSSKKNCLDCVKNAQTECDCPAPCKENVYQVTLTSARSQMDSFVPDCGSYCNTTTSNDYATMSVYFHSMTKVVNVETPAYGLYNVYSDFCSVTGLLLGICIMTVFEVLLFFLRIIYTCLRKCVKH